MRSRGRPGMCGSSRPYNTGAQTRSATPERNGLINFLVDVSSMGSVTERSCTPILAQQARIQIIFSSLGVKAYRVHPLWVPGNHLQ